MVSDNLSQGIDLPTLQAQLERHTLLDLNTIYSTTFTGAWVTADSISPTITLAGDYLIVAQMRVSHTVKDIRFGMRAYDVQGAQVLAEETGEVQTAGDYQQFACGIVYPLPAGLRTIRLDVNLFAGPGQLDVTGMGIALIRQP